MAKIWLIASRELRAYFETWTGYIIIILAILIDGLLFNSFAMGNEPKLSSNILVDFFYLSSGIAMIAAVFLAMRLVSEEKQAGTLVLLFTSPITERQLVYGKFLSAVMFFLLFLLLTLHLPALILLEGKVSWGHIVAGYLGVFLLGSVVLSITLFASVIAPNQIVSAVVGASITVVMLILWMLSGVVDEPFKELYMYLAIHNKHFISFARGMVHSRDIVYYISVAVFFLECSIHALEARRLNG